ncbi:MAG: LacI family DNA-binding transcriptional regulator [Pseudomonadota bacterium]
MVQKKQGTIFAGMNTVSIKEVARLAGVSIATVSRYINAPEKVSEKTREKVRTAIETTNYSPNTLAQSFRRGRTNMIMVVLPSVGDPFFEQVLKGIRTAAQAKGYSIVIEETQRNTMTADQIGAMLVSKQTDGILLLASLSPFGTDVLSANSQRRLPIVIGCETVSPELAKFSGVHIDNVAAGIDATAYLITKGHRRIGMITGQVASLLTQDRELGYRTALKNAGIDCPDGWVVNGELSIGGARHAMRALLEHPQRPTAVFCATDEMAIGALHEVKQAGMSVPSDISIMGFDDMRFAAVCDPPLTTIAQPAETIGERAIYRLCHEIEAGETAVSEQEVLPHRLVVRESVAAPS